MSDERWYYFLSIEKDFTRTVDFLEIHSNNARAFSNQYAKLLLLIGSEVDVVAKMLCARESPNQKVGNINEYRVALTTRFKGFETIEIDLPRFNLRIQPWLSWGAVVPTSPAWWLAYNKVKHQRDQHFSDANQENTISALCGLMALLLYWFKGDPNLQPFPELLNYGLPEFVVSGGGRKLPGY